MEITGFNKKFVVPYFYLATIKRKERWEIGWKYRNISISQKNSVSVEIKLPQKNCSWNSYKFILREIPPAYFFQTYKLVKSYFQRKKMSRKSLRPLKKKPQELNFTKIRRSKYRGILKSQTARKEEKSV